MLMGLQTGVQRLRQYRRRVFSYVKPKPKEKHMSATMPQPVPAPEVPPIAPQKESLEQKIENGFTDVLHFILHGANVVMSPTVQAAAKALLQEAVTALSAGG